MEVSPCSSSSPIPKLRTDSSLPLPRADLGFDNRKAKRDPLPRRPRDVAPTRVAAPVAPRPKPSLVVADDDDYSSSSRPPRALSSYEQRASQTFGQRAREAAAGKGRKGVDDEEWKGLEETDVVRGAPGGGMEMSFIPMEKTKEQKAEEKAAKMAKKSAEKKEKSSFGAGMEKRGDGPDEEEVVMEGEAESGRTRMRRPQRSASRNVTRQL